MPILMICKQTGGCIYQEVSGYVPFAVTYSEKKKKKRPEKFPFIAAFSCSEFLVILEKWWRKGEEERQLRSVMLFKQTHTYT